MASERSAPFVVGFGSEDFLLDRMRDRARNWKNRHSVLLDGEDISSDELVTECESHAFGSTGRVIVVDNAHKVKGDSLSTFIEERSSSDLSVVLVAIIRAEKLPKVWAAAAKKGRVEEFQKFKPWEEAKKIGRIQDEARRLGLTLDAGIPEMFLKLLGDDLRATANELSKLVYLVSKDGVVKKDHVSKVVTHVFPVEPWEVADAAAAKNLRTAMSKLGLVFKHMGEGAAVPVTASLMRMAEKLIVVRQALDKGDSPDVAAQMIGMHPFAFKKNLLPLAQKHTVAKLREDMVRLCALEVQVKGAARSKRTLVELAVLSFAA